MSKGNPHRPIRISDEVWTKAQAKAARHGTTASAKARELLEWWANQPDWHPAPGDYVTAEGLEHIDHCAECKERYLGR